MDMKSVCAVIVTFRPRDEDYENILKVRAQVDNVVVVDNGSPHDSLLRLRALSKESCLTLIENGANLGIGAALNIGVRSAETSGSRWVILLDQDSTVTENFMERMVSDFTRGAGRLNLGQIVPRYIDPKSGIERIFGVAKDQGPFVTITSGSFFPTEIFSKCGYFREELFIYTVDDEYSLRLRSMGYSIAQSRDAVLLHASGHPTHFSLFGRRLFSPSNHSAGARYYLNRNRIWMLRTYGLRFPRWTAWIMIGTVKEIFKIAVAEKQRLLKFAMMLHGIRDGILMRMGKTVEL